MTQHASDVERESWRLLDQAEEVLRDIAAAFVLAEAEQMAQANKKLLEARHNLDDAYEAVREKDDPVY